MSEFARAELSLLRPGRPSALTIGNFDGVHLGHQHLVRFLIERARAESLAAGVVTLYPDPVRVLRPQEPMQYLTSLEERLELLRGLGLDFVIPLSFTSELAELSPRAFVGLLREQLDMRLLVMGPDNAFGRNREATPEQVGILGESLGFAVETLPRHVQAVEAPISATNIRRALAEGDLASVERQLGRRYSLRGPVVHGDKRGRTIGFPTANVGVTADRALPAHGIYATWAEVGGRRYQSATNVGTRPTFDGRTVSVEAYLMDFEGDIYDQTLRLEFVARLREERRFDSVEALVAEMQRDVERARQLLGETGDDASARPPSG
jgi:riboflavin kinase/FMN adenylyltransferase